MKDIKWEFTDDYRACSAQVERLFHQMHDQLDLAHKEIYLLQDVLSARGISEKAFVAHCLTTDGPDKMTGLEVGALYRWICQALKTK